jgi:hypothetical protein
MELQLYVLVLKIILITLLVLVAISYTISLWFIFKKENIKEYYALIPFFNIYKLFKIINIPFYMIFIPLANIVVIDLIPYKLLKRYKREKWLEILSIFFPYIIICYIAFSKKCVPEKNPRSAIKTLLELENIENNLENYAEINDFSFGGAFDEKKEINKQKYISNTEEMINKMEKNAIVDDYYFENEVVDEQLESKKQESTIPNVDNNITDIIEIFDQEENSLLTSSIDNMEEKLKNDNKIKRIDNAEYKDYKQKESSNESIAFGGKEKRENATHTKNEETKCSRCGSSLVGATGYCPGCGLKID